MAARLQGRVAVVIGAGSIGPGWGNGKATAVLFAREGASVFAVDLSGDAAEETVAIIASEGGEAVAHQADVSSAEDVERVMARCVERFGRIDVLHHNVGIERAGGPVELTLDEWRRVIDVNLTSAFLACKHVLPIMERQGSGAIVTVGSIAGMRYTGVPSVSYSASKAGLAQLTVNVALQYAAKGIRANCIAPGLMNTPRIRERLPIDHAHADLTRLWESRDRQCPTGHMGDAWDVARAALFLASDEARYITGQTLLVDGGITAKYA
jgi:NAD(P)-dependent dehydrogenase (short-subunit alcohol dehydrogenase family)